MESAFSCCNFVLASLLKRAPFWQNTLHFGGRQFRSHSDIIPKEHKTLFGAISNPKTYIIMAKITPIDIIKVISVKFGGGKSFTASFCGIVVRVEVSV